MICSYVFQEFQALWLTLQLWRMRGMVLPDRPSRSMRSMFFLRHNFHPRWYLLHQDGIKTKQYHKKQALELQITCYAYFPATIPEHCRKECLSTPPPILPFWCRKNFLKKIVLRSRSSWEVLFGSQSCAALFFFLFQPFLFIKPSRYYHLSVSWLEKNKRC